MANKLKGNLHLSRRKFIKGMGVISIGFSLQPLDYALATKSVSQELPSSLRRHPAINAWLQILEDGTIRILTGKMELGQGLSTAILQVAGEELNTDPASLQLVLAETGTTPNEGYTAGSRSMETSAMSVRYAAAAARQKLIELAARKKSIAPDQLTMEDGMVIAGNQKFLLNDLLQGEQLEDEVKLPVRLKSRQKYSWVGKPVKNPRLQEMVHGSYQYVQDLKFDGMLYGQVIRPNGYNSKIKSIDSNVIARIPGVVKLIHDGDFVGVVAESTYQAITAAEEATKHITWTKSKNLPDSDQLKDYILSLPTDNQQVTTQGDSGSGGDFDHQATYFKPYIMHGASGPSCAVALYENERLDIWSHSQGVYPLRESLANMLKMSPEKIHIKGVPGSGCYGHNGADDVAADAALMAIENPSRPVQVQWSRQGEHRWEPYGSAMVMQLQANLNSQGKISNWKYDLWSDSHSTRPGGDPASLLAARHISQSFQLQSEGYRGGAHRNSAPYYQIPNLKIDAHFFKGPLRVSALRSLGAFANIFALESFMDELAHAADQDPLAFRLRHSDDTRVIELLERMQEEIKEETVSENEGIGFGFSRYKNVATYCVVAAKVRYLPEQEKIKLLGFQAVVDAGEIINPDGLKNQIEGGIAQAASWTMAEAVKFDQDGLISVDWTSYPVLAMEHFWETRVHLIDRPDEPPLGAGEAAQGPTAAAIANAIFAATGKRVRDLPVGVG